MGNVVNNRTKPRYGVVSILGHIDHGKTSLLDYLRKTSVASNESGGITQKIAAFSYESNDRKVTFVDCPGHAAFSNMRMRGAELTDVVILVVASDDGVMEQTVESIKMIRKAGTNMVVAINKCDLKKSNPQLTMKQLESYGVICEPLGGDVQCENISAVTGRGMSSLMEKVTTEIEMMELKSDYQANVQGVVLETRTDKHLGTMATCITKHGTLKKGQILVSGRNYARVKILLDEQGKQISKCAPSQVVCIGGWKIKNENVESGQPIVQVKNEATAKKILELRQKLDKKEKLEFETLMVTESREQEKKIFNEMKEKMSNVYERYYAVVNKLNETIHTNSLPTYNIIVKADTMGSLEVINNLLSSYNNSDVTMNVISTSVGDLTSGEVERAAVGEASIYLFNVDSSPALEDECTTNGVKLHSFSVIYHLLDHLKEDLTNLIPETYELTQEGEADVVQLFESGKSQIVCGCTVTNGIINKKNNYQLIRNEKIVDEGTIESIRNEKLVVETIKSGKECGIVLKTSSDIITKPQEGDIIKTGIMTKAEKYLEWYPEGF